MGTPSAPGGFRWEGTVRYRELEYTTIDQVEGSADAWVPKLACSASVAGGPIDSFDLKPVFINALDALWGRADFLSAFQLELNEPAQSFTIRRY